jgi:hypothetical protein
VPTQISGYSLARHTPSASNDCTSSSSARQHSDFDNSGQFQPIAFLDYCLQTLSPIGVIDFQGFVRAFVRISAHIDIGDQHIQRCSESSFEGVGLRRSPNPFTVDRSIDLQLANLCVYKCGGNECRHEQ